MRAYSPIRSLDDREGRRLIEQELQEARLRREMTSRLEEENVALRRKLHRTANESEADVHTLILRNSRLQEEVELMGQKVYQTAAAASVKEYHSTKVQRNLTDELAFLTRQNESLKLEVTAKSAELESTLRQLATVQGRYDQEIALLTTQNRDLKGRLQQAQRQQFAEVEVLKRKYTALHMDDSEAMRSTHTQEVRFLLEEIDKLRLALTDKSTELQIQFQDRREIKERYDLDLGQKIAEINELKNKLMVVESQANREIRDLDAKRSLERSRTAIVIEGSKESTIYLEKEIQKLTRDLSDKNNQLENLTKSYLSEKKRNEESQKTFNDKLTEVRREHEELQRDKLHQFEKRQSILKEEVLEKKKKETELYLHIDRLEKELEVAAHEQDLLRKNNRQQESEITALKLEADKQREEHLKQITKLMNEKIKRRSSRVLSSQRSLNDSLKDSNLVEVQGEHPVGPGHLVGDLHQIKEEVYLRESNRSKENQSFVGMEEQEHDDFAGLVAHYEQLIEELKKSHNVDTETANLKIQRLESSLRDKQAEYEDVLRRFAPLVLISAGKKSLEDDRRERIERHWKADIALLVVLLEKHKIQVLEPEHSLPP